MIDETDIREELERLADVNGGILQAQHVVAAARAKTSILHPLFTWDDKEAAEEYRLMEARFLIRRVRLINPEDLKKQPAFVSLKADRREAGGGYRRTADVLSSEELREQLRDTALSELSSWRERYRVLNDLVDSVSEAAGLEPPAKDRIDVRPRRKAK